jgi:hypothetical protein
MGIELVMRTSVGAFEVVRIVGSVREVGSEPSED